MQATDLITRGFVAADAGCSLALLLGAAQTIHLPEPWATAALDTAAGTTAVGAPSVSPQLLAAAVAAEPSCVRFLPESGLQQLRVLAAADATASGGGGGGCLPVQQLCACLAAARDGAAGGGGEALATALAACAPAVDDEWVEMAAAARDGDSDGGGGTGGGRSQQLAAAPAALRESLLQVLAKIQEQEASSCRQERQVRPRMHRGWSHSSE